MELYSPRWTSINCTSQVRRNGTLGGDVPTQSRMGLLTKALRYPTQKDWLCPDQSWSERPNSNTSNQKWKGISLVLCSQLNGIRQKTRVSMIRHEWQRTSEIRHKTRVSVIRHEWQRTSEIRHKTRVSVIRHEWQGTRTLLQVSYVESPTKREVLVELRHKPKAGLFILDIWMKYSS